MKSRNRNTPRKKQHRTKKIKGGDPTLIKIIEKSNERLK
jgi:hypothetical protein